jgi:hypothetical protein
MKVVDMKSNRRISWTERAEIFKSIPDVFYIVAEIPLMHQPTDLTLSPQNNTSAPPETSSPVLS